VMRPFVKILWPLVAAVLIDCDCWLELQRERETIIFCAWFFLFFLLLYFYSKHFRRL